MATYQYDITDTLNDALNSEHLRQEITDSSIVPTLTLILYTGSTGKIDITFNTDLSGAEQTTLDGVVAAHDGTAIDPSTKSTYQSVTKEWDLFIDDDGVVNTEEKV